MNFRSSLRNQLQSIFEYNIFRVHKNATTIQQILTLQQVHLYQNKAELVVTLTLNKILITSNKLVLQAILFNHWTNHGFVLCKRSRQQIQNNNESMCLLIFLLFNPTFAN